MKTTILKSWQEFSTLEKEWNSLLESSKSNTIFLTWEWIQSWHAVVGEDTGLFVITVRDDEGRLVGVAPFYKYRFLLLNSIPYRALRILADYATGAEYGDWIVDPKCEQAALDAIATTLSKSHEWDVIWMWKMSGWTGAFERISSAANQAGMLFRSRTATFSAVDLPEKMDVYLSGFSSRRRKYLRKTRESILPNPGVEITHLMSMDEIPEYLDNLFDLHHRRRISLGNNDPGCFIRKPAEAAFYKEFLPRALEKGWLRFFVLKENNQAQAIQIGYAYNNIFLALQDGLNPDYIDGVGNVLRYGVIEACVNEKLINYDFLGGFTEHKRRWGAQQRNGYDLLIARPCLKTKLLFFKDVWPTGRYIKELGLFKGN